MSFKALKTAFKFIEGADMSPCAKLVFLGLSNRHNQETGRCDPSIETLASDLRIGERSVRRGLRELEGLRLIQTVHRQVRTGKGRRNLTNRYRLKGGAKMAGGVGPKWPTKQEIHARDVSAFDDLAMLIEENGDGGSYE